MNDKIMNLYSFSACATILQKLRMIYKFEETPKEVADKTIQEIIDYLNELDTKSLYRLENSGSETFNNTKILDDDDGYYEVTPMDRNDSGIGSYLLLREDVADRLKVHPTEDVMEDDDYEAENDED